MSRDDIIRMAQETGMKIYSGNFADDIYVSVLYRFANLVAAAEREACATVCEKIKGVKLQGYEFEQPAQQEPVACKHRRYSVDAYEQTGECYDCGAEGRMKFVVDDAPPKREWVGLTDEEVDEIYMHEGHEDVVLLAQAKLKEKNT